MIHEFHPFMGVVNDGFAIAPRYRGDQKASDLNIFLACEQVWDLNGIVRDKVWHVVLQHLCVEKFLEFGFFQMITKDF